MPQTDLALPDTPADTESPATSRHRPAVAATTPAATLTERINYARALSDAQLLPSAYRRQPANVLFAIEYAAALNLPPMAAITGVHVIDGKPTASAGLISALVRRAGHRLRIRIDHDDHDRPVAVAEIVRADDPGFTYSSTWTLDRALTAGLVDSLDIDQTGRTVIRARTSNGKPSSWEKYPEAMLKARAISEVARDACEEALSGVHYTPEEVGAAVDGDGQIIDGTLADDTQPEPPPDHGLRPASRGQLTALHAALGEAGVTDRADKLAWAGEQVGRPLHSSADLTAGEASQLLDTLAARRTDNDTDTDNTDESEATA